MSIPKKAIEYFDQIIAAHENDSLVLMQGYFNGQERTLICISIPDADENGEEIERMYPRALIIDEDIDSLHNCELVPLNEIGRKDV